MIRAVATMPNGIGDGSSFGGCSKSVLAVVAASAAHPVEDSGAVPAEIAAASAAIAAASADVAVDCPGCLLSSRRLIERSDRGYRCHFITY